MFDILQALFDAITSALSFVANIIPFITSIINYIKSALQLVPNFASPYVIVAFAICIFLGIKKAVLF